MQDNGRGLKYAASILFLKNWKREIYKKHFIRRSYVE